MEYPGAVFTRPWRLFVLGIFIFLFCVLVPAVLLYTAGFRYDIKNGLLKATGSVNIDILPKNAVVYLNDLLIHKDIPIRLTNIKPQTYRLRISAPNYYDWEKQIVVTNEQTTYINNIHLLKKASPEQIATGTIPKIALSTDGQYLAYTKASSASSTELWLYNTQKKIFLHIRSIASLKPVRLIWAPRTNFLALTDNSNSSPTLVVIDSENIEHQFDIQSTTSAPIISFEWRNTTEPELYYNTSTTLNVLFPRLQHQLPVATHTFMDWHIDDGELWALENSTTTGQLRIIKDVLGFMTPWTTITLPTNATTSGWRIAAAHKAVVWLKQLHSNELLLVTPNKYRQFSQGQFVRSLKSGEWIIWTPWELWDFPEEGEPYLINRFSDTLAQVLPLDEATLALLRGNKLAILFSSYNIEQELAPQSISAFTVDTSRRILYFVDNQGLWKLPY